MYLVSISPNPRPSTIAIVRLNPALLTLTPLVGPFITTIIKG